MLSLIANVDASVIGEFVRYGILGLVLMWLFYVRWPANDKNDKETQERHDAQMRQKDEDIKALAVQHAATEKAQREDGREREQAILTHCEHEAVKKDARITQLEEWFFSQKGRQVL